MILKKVINLKILVLNFLRLIILDYLKDNDFQDKDLKLIIDFKFFIV